MVFLTCCRARALGGGVAVWSLLAGGLLPAPLFAAVRTSVVGKRCTESKSPDSSRQRVTNRLGFGAGRIPRFRPFLTFLLPLSDDRSA